MYRLDNIKIADNLTDEEVIKKAIQKYRINAKNVEKAYIFKKSIDARDKQNIVYNYSVDVKLKNNMKLNNAKLVEEYKFEDIKVNRKSKFQPVIVGSGPAGLFCALTLVQNNVSPIILEQGSMVEKRIEDVERFKKTGVLNTSSNIQFGEGGAGTFSDGKLNTGNTSIYSRKVLEEFVNFGAPKEILYLAKPHIGTDNLVKIVKNIRTYLVKHGAKFMFNTKVIDIDMLEDNLLQVITNNEDKILTDTVVLAIGHSARDTFKMLNAKGIKMLPKNFAIGVRIEHLQSDINIAQFGNNPKFKLPPAEYKLVYHTKKDRACYTFCMCPGGQVVASSSDEKTVVTNGMSNFKRDGVNSNSALLVTVTDKDFGTEDVLAGMYYQEDLENKAYIMGGQSYYAPIQTVSDYLKNVKTEKLGKVIPTYKPGVTFANLNELFPEYINEAIKETLLELDKKLKGFACDDAILTAVETRTSSPVQITRDRVTMQSNIKGIYPCGEGAGYAGGIMTSSIDGIKVAIQILSQN